MSGVGSDLPVAAFDYDLPSELIAQTPLEVRDSSRMLVVNRETHRLTHDSITSLPTWLDPGDLIVANNSRVIPARIKARRVPTGGLIEFLLLQRDEDGVWSALAKPARRLHVGDSLDLIARSPDSGAAGSISIVDCMHDGLVRLRFHDKAETDLAAFGVVPLPPYIRASLEDQDRYQTLYAAVPGSAAAPTAGLHVTPRLRESLQARGVAWAEVTLHIGLDTFRPVTVERVADHQIHTEWCTVSAEVADRIAKTRRNGGRVIALGTTAARTLETLGSHWESAPGSGFAGPTGIFITPGYRWKLVNALLTNFHLPRSTLLMMISALAGRETILAAYHEAIAEKYRFFSFGDAMLIV